MMFSCKPRRAVFPVPGQALPALGILLSGVLMLGIGMLGIGLARPARAEDRRPDKTTLTVMALNCEFLWDGVAPEEGAASVKFPWKGNQALAEAHMKQVANLILRSDPDVVSMEEVENLHAVQVLNDKFLPGRGYKPYFIQGKDTFTGQDVALLSRIDPDGGVIERDDREGRSGTATSQVSKNYFAKMTVGTARIALIGLHLLAQPTSLERMPKRQAQAEVVRALAVELEKQGRQVIVLGDLNDWDGEKASRDQKDDQPTTNVLATIRGMDPADPKDDLVNAAAFMPKEDRYSDFWDQNNNNVVEAPQEFSMIDHILLAPALAAQVEDACIPHEEDPRTVSDHFPVVVRLRLTKAPAGQPRP